LDRIFCKIVYHHIIYMCDFFVNLDDFFVVVCTNFYEGRGFHQIRFLASVVKSGNCTMLHSGN